MYQKSYQGSHGTHFHPPEIHKRKYQKIEND